MVGGTSSGKTTIVNQILHEFPEKEISVISQDSYYKETTELNTEERSRINFDHPDSIDFNLLISHLKMLKKGKPINQPVYSFVEHNRTTHTVLTQPKKVLILEGILILVNPQLREILDIKVFIDTDKDERLIRRLKRDILDRGRDLDEVIARYLTHVKPMHNKFIEPMKAYADIIIPNNKHNTSAIDVLKTIITNKL